ncbi:MAG: MBL fold metallo-hydrolase [Patescibacteria group bacterium]
MQISWHGLSCFSLTVSSINGDATLVVDPYQAEVGLKLSRTLAADVVAMTHGGDDANNAEAVGPTSHGAPFVIDMAGEYEAKGIFVHAIDVGGHQRILLIEAEGMSVAHLGAINRELTNDELEALSNVDILLVPIGGGRFLSPKMAVEVIAQIEPRIVIPYAYAVDGLKEKLEPLDAFCKALGVCKRENVSKLKISRKNLPEEEMMIYVLERA